MFAGIDHFLWNDQMDVTANIIIIINCVMAFISGAVNLYASKHNPEPWKKIRFMVGVFAIIYGGCYLWLLSSEDLERWSSVMRGVSLVVWPLVWIAPAWVSIRVWIDVKKILRVDQEKANKDTEQLKRNEEL